MTYVRDSVSAILFSLEYVIGYPVYYTTDIIRMYKISVDTNFAEESTIYQPGVRVIEITIIFSV